MIKVYETREDIVDRSQKEYGVQPNIDLERNDVCLSSIEYHGIVTTIVVSQFQN